MFYILIIAFTHGGCNQKILRTRPLPLTLCTPTSTCFKLPWCSCERSSQVRRFRIRLYTVWYCVHFSCSILRRLVENPGSKPGAHFRIESPTDFCHCRRAFISKTHQIHFVVPVCHFLPTSAPCSLMQSLLKSTPGVTLGCCWDASLWCVC